ncbi:MAG: F0F1 ATP synthase subunit B [Thermonemataceae bacterium]
MDLVTPELGLIFWQTVIFILLLVVLGRFAWKPILQGLRERESSIASALKSAEEAKVQMAKITSDNEKLLDEARAEKDDILKKATQTAKKMVEEAKDDAKKEANRIVEEARQAIENEKKAALSEIKKQVASLSLEIAEKVLQKKLADEPSQKALVEDLLKDTNLN